MKNKNHDETIKRNYLRKYLYLIQEYELIKTKKHPKFKLVKEFYKAHDLDHRSFLKYYARYKQSGKPEDLLPQKRGPRWKTRRPVPYIENKVIELRLKGLNKYEIVNILKPKLKQHTPSPSGVYNIIKRGKLNRLTPKMSENKRKIIKEKAGELGHIDVHHLSKCIIQGENKKRYMVCVIDDCTRLAWTEIVEDIKALTVMFATLKCLNMLADRYNIRFKEMLTDNGAEFGTKTSKKKQEHPFERLLIELEIKHRYTRPYRPQTNGKVERFWRTLQEDLLDETFFETVKELQEELWQYMYYYNHERPHQALGGQTPYEFSEKCPRIT